MNKRKTLVVVIILALLPSGIARPQAALPPSLENYDWTRWLIGEWEGWAERADGTRAPIWQKFEYALDGRYILTTLVRNVGEPDEYKGMGVFIYYPDKDEAYGNWFGIFHDTNDGRASRDGSKMIWDIERFGERIIRTRERVGEDKFVVTNRTTAPDGNEIVTREELKRVK